MAALACATRWLVAQMAYQQKALYLTFCTRMGAEKAVKEYLHRRIIFRLTRTLIHPKQFSRDSSRSAGSVDGPYVCAWSILLENDSIRPKKEEVMYQAI
jgi:hypothetical protein